MTVFDATSKVRTVADGIIVAFDFDFKILAAGDISVYTIVRSTSAETLQTITTEYTVAINTTTEGGTVTFVTAPLSTEDVFIVREIDFTQTTVIPKVGFVGEEKLEDVYDRLVMMLQQVLEIQNRSLVSSQFDATIPTSIPALVEGGVLTAVSGVMEWDTTLSDIVVEAGAVPGAIDPDDDDKVLRASGGAWSWQDFLIDNISDATTYGKAVLAASSASNVVAAAPYPVGLAVSSGTDSAHDIDIATGSMPDSASAQVLTLSSGFTKQIDATWAVGTAAGGLFSGASLTADTVYHAFLIEKDLDSSIDVGIDDNLTATNIETGYTAFGRVASFKTDSAANIIPFYQTRIGSQTIVRLHAPVLDVDELTSLAASRTTFTLSVPTGFKVMAHLSVYMNKVDEAIMILDPDADRVIPLDSQPAGDFTAPILCTISDGGGGSVNGNNNRMVDIMTDTTGSITAESTAAATTFAVTTHGWTEES